MEKLMKLKVGDKIQVIAEDATSKGEIYFLFEEMDYCPLGDHGFRYYNLTTGKFGWNSSYILSKTHWYKRVK